MEGAEDRIPVFDRRSVVCIAELVDFEASLIFAREIRESTRKGR